jgi:hypothetical protein
MASSGLSSLFGSGGGADDDDDDDPLVYSRPRDPLARTSPPAKVRPAVRARRPTGAPPP